MATVNEIDNIANNNNSIINSEIGRFFQNKSIFITGGTGYLGSLLVHKLLRCGVKEIILLVRQKKSKSVEERMNDLLDRPIFETLKPEMDMYRSRLTIVEGDLKDLKAGLSKESESLVIDRTQIIFHAAADVRFDESIKQSIYTNVRGTNELLKMAEKMVNLEVFVYVSTAYSNCTRQYIEEKFYPVPMNPDIMIKLMEQIENTDRLDVITEKIIRPWPNTYAFTKVLAEDVIKQYGHKFKIGIVRPSIVVNTFQDPIPGWTDNIYGLNGVITGAALGILRILQIDNTFQADIIPADIVNNTTMAVAWCTANEKCLNNSTDVTTKENNIKIYNNTAYPDNPITWGDIKDKTNTIGLNYPVMQSLWISTYNTTKNDYVYEFLKLIYHIIPAYFFDAFLALKGEKKMVLHLYRKIHKFAGVISFFTNNEWTFENSNMRNLCDMLSDEDRLHFPLDIQKLDWDDFFPVYLLGLRQYIAKENLNNLEQAKKRYRKLKIIHYIFLFVLYSLTFYGFIRIMEIYNLNIFSIKS